jgi:hypothetical protein
VSVLIDAVCTQKCIAATNARYILFLNTYKLLLLLYMHILSQIAFREADGVNIMVNHLQAYCKHAQSKAHAQQQQQQQASDSALLATMSTLSSSSVMGRSSIPRQSPIKLTGVTDNDTLTVLVLHCIWNAIVGNKRSEARFLQCEVMYMTYELYSTLSIDEYKRKACCVL